MRKFRRATAFLLSMMMLGSTMISGYQTVDVKAVEKEKKFISSEKTPTSASGEFKEFCLSGSTISD